MKKTFLLLAVFFSLIFLSCQGGVSERDLSIASSVVESGVDANVTPEADESDFLPPASPVISEYSAAGKGSVFLSWKNPDDSDFYAVQVSANAEEANYEFPVLVKGCPSCEGGIFISGLENGREYEFTLRSVDVNLNMEENGVSIALTPAESEEISILPPSVEIDNIVNDDGVIEFSWHLPEDSNFYYGELKSEPAEGNLSEAFVFSQGRNYFRALGLTDGVSHQFTFTSYNQSLECVSVTTVATPLAADTTPPENVTFKSEIKNGSVLLTWNRPEKNDDLYFEVSWKDQKQTVPAGTEGETFYSFSTGGFENGESVIFTIAAYDGAGNKSEDVSQEVVFKENTNSALTLLVEEGEVTEENTVPVQVSVSTLNENVYLSRLVWAYGYYKTANRLLREEASTDITEAKSFQAGKNGTYTLAALDSYGNVATAYFTVMGLDETPPAEVLVPSAFSGDSAAFLSWTAPWDEDFACVSVSAQKDGTEEISSVTLYAAPGDEMKYTASELENEKAYTFTICTKDKFGNTSKGTVFSSIIPARASTEKNDVEVKELKLHEGNESVTLYWELPEENDVYAVSVSAKKDGEETFTYLATVPAGQTYYHARFLENDAKYTFLVQTVDSFLRTTEGLVSEPALPSREADETAPAPVKNLSCESAKKKVTLTWENPEDIDLLGLKLVLSDENGKVLSSIPLKRSVQTYTLTDLKKDASYKVTLLATDASGNWSEEESLTVSTTAK